MKIRQGFVSNSSSSSFCIYGCCIDDGWSNMDKIDIGSLEEKIKGKDIEIIYGPQDSTYLGRHFSSIKDDETGKQFKEKTEKEVKDHVGEKFKCRIIEEGWYDG